MYICICYGVTDGDIQRCIKDKGVKDIKGLHAELGACGQCGKCVPEAKRLLANGKGSQCFNKQDLKAA